MFSTRHYIIIMTPSKHHHDIIKTSPLRLRRISDIRLLHAEGSPTIADSQNTSLTVADIEQINFRIIPYASPNIQQNIEYSSNARQYIACVLSRWTTRSISAPIATRTSIFHCQYIAKYFGSRGTIASLSCHISGLIINNKRCNVPNF